MYKAEIDEVYKDSDATPYVIVMGGDSPNQSEDCETAAFIALRLNQREAEK